MEHFSNYHKDHPNQHENGHKLCNETRHPVLSLRKSQCDQYDQNFPIEGKPLENKYYHQKKERNPNN